MRRGRTIAWLVLVAALVAGCGGNEQEGAPEAPAALAYVPPDASVVLVVPTDLEGSQLRRLERLIAPELRTAGVKSLREGLDQIAAEGKLDYERDIAPLLGAPLVAALSGSVQDGGAILALETPDGERLRRVLEAFDAERQGEHRGALLYDGAAVDGDTLLVSLDADLRAAIDRRRDGGGMQAAAMGALEGAPEERLVTGFATAGGLARLDPALRKAAELPWLRAARDYGFWVALEEDAVRGGARVRTEPGGLDESSGTSA